MLNKSCGLEAYLVPRVFGGKIVVIVKKVQNRTMISKILVGVSAAVVVMVMFMAIFGASYIANPKFTVINKSTSPVVLTVVWGDKSQPYGNIGPDQQIKFSVNAEAEMTLLAKYSDGYTVASLPTYLSAGSLTKAKIFDTYIEFE